MLYSRNVYRHLLRGYQLRAIVFCGRNTYNIQAMKYFIKTFGCQQNEADSERIRAALEGRGMKAARSYKDSNYVVINTCMIRESAENRVYGLVKNLGELKAKRDNLKIIVTGCMVGVAFRDKTGKVLKKIKKAMPDVDEFMPI